MVVKKHAQNGSFQYTVITVCIYIYSIYYIYRCETGDGMSFGPPAGRKYLSF